MNNYSRFEATAIPSQMVQRRFTEAPDNSDCLSIYHMALKPANHIFWYLTLFGAGLALGIIATMRNDSALIFLLIPGLGSAAGGFMGAAAVWNLTNTYEPHVKTFEQVLEPNEAHGKPSEEKIRPEVHSRGGAMIRRGRIALTREQWVLWGKRIRANDDRVIRDTVPSGAIKNLTSVWGRVEEDLKELGFVDSNKRLTSDGEGWFSSPHSP